MASARNWTAAELRRVRTLQVRMTRRSGRWWPRGTDMWPGYARRITAMGKHGLALLALSHDSFRFTCIAAESEFEPPRRSPHFAGFSWNAFVPYVSASLGPLLRRRWPCLCRHTRGVVPAPSQSNLSWRFCILSFGRLDLVARCVCSCGESTYQVCRPLRVLQVLWLLVQTMWLDGLVSTRTTVTDRVKEGSARAAWSLRSAAAARWMTRTPSSAPPRESSL